MVGRWARKRCLRGSLGLIYGAGRGGGSGRVGRGGRGLGSTAAL